MEIIGYIGAFLLATCALPQTVASIATGNSYGLTMGFLWSWLLGEVFMLVFVVDSVGTGGPVFWNLAANIWLLLPIVYYRHFPRRLK